MTRLQYRALREEIAGLTCVTVLPEVTTGQPAQPRAVGVFCHGFGAGGDDLVGLAGELLQVAGGEQPMALIFPAAPLSLDEAGMPGGRAWWLLSVQRLLSALEEGRYEQVREEVPPGIDEARDKLTATIEAVLSRYELTESQLLLGGFSQGAMLSVETACLGLKQPPAKLCLYSAALICEKRWTPQASRLSETGILQSHGRLDPILPLQTGVWLRDMLEDAGCAVDFIEFSGPHTIPQESVVKTAGMLAALAQAE